MVPAAWGGGERTSGTAHDNKELKAASVALKSESKYKNDATGGGGGA